MSEAPLGSGPRGGATPRNNGRQIQIPSVSSPRAIPEAHFGPCWPFRPLPRSERLLLAVPEICAAVSLLVVVSSPMLPAAAGANDGSPGVFGVDPKGECR